MAGHRTGRVDCAGAWAPRWGAGLVLQLMCGLAGAADLALTVPADVDVSAAQAVVPGAEKLGATGHVASRTVTFAGLVPDAAYDIRLTLRDGRILWGVNVGWYDMEEVDASAGPLSDDDRKEIQDICNIPSFYDKSTVLLYTGNHDRATGLMQLLRDRNFHAGKNEVIWRAEVWFFKFQNGGWERVNQQMRLMDRRRFASPAEYKKAVGPIRFIPRLGGITPQKKDERLKVELSSEDVQKGIPAIPDSAPEIAPAGR